VARPATSQSSYRTMVDAARHDPSPGSHLHYAAIVAPRTRSPSPLVGEGGPSRRRGPGEGSAHASDSDPSPGSRPGSPPSPTRGEGGPSARHQSSEKDRGLSSAITPASASAHRARPWRRGPGSRSASRDRRA
jgi:hypothetical protein